MEFFIDLVDRLKQQVDPALLGEETTQDEVRQLAATVAYIILDAMADGVVDRDGPPWLDRDRERISGVF